MNAVSWVGGKFGHVEISRNDAQQLMLKRAGEVASVLEQTEGNFCDTDIQRLAVFS